MSSNCISADGAISIALVMRESQCLVLHLALQDNSISGSAEDLGRALAQLPSLRHVDLADNFHDACVTDCCSVFALMISSKAPTATLMLPANLFTEFPSLFSRNRTSSASQHTNSCWCGGRTASRIARFVFTFSLSIYRWSSYSFQMRVPLLLLHNIDHDQFNNWAPLLPPVRSMVNFAIFAAACMLGRPQHQPSPFNIVNTKSARATAQSLACLSFRQRARVCASSALAGVLSLRMTLPPPNFTRTRKCNDARCIRSRVGGLRLLASLVLETLYLSNSGGGSEECAGNWSENSSSVSCLTSDDGSDSSSSSSSNSSNERPSERIAGSQSKRRRK